MVYDRDYWSANTSTKCGQSCTGAPHSVHFHCSKEIENYLLVSSAFTRALIEAVLERKNRGELERSPLPTEQDVRTLLEEITDSEKAAVQAQYIARRQEYFRSSHSKLDSATIAQEALRAIDSKWRTLDTPIEVVCGKTVLAALRQRVRMLFSVNVGDNRIIRCFHKDEVPVDLRELVEGLERFRNMRPAPVTPEDGPSEDTAV